MQVQDDTREPKPNQKQPQLCDDDMARILQARFHGDEEKLQQVQVLLPPQPKSEEELRKEARDRAMAAAKKYSHEAKVLQDMQTRYARMAGALLEYSTQVEEQESKASDARDAKIEAE